MTKKRGLTLGKYAPLHKGHQLVIETALAEMDEVAVLIYDCPETTPVPLSVRSNWIRTLYPAVQVIEAWNGPTIVGNTPEIRRQHEDFIIKELGISGITHFYSSEFYGEHMSKALGAVNRIVDEHRRLVPVAGTEIRNNPYAYREYLHPRVYRDLVANIVFLGAPSTGKTTLAETLAGEFNTVWMPEYGREYWEKHQINRRLSPEQLVEIAEEHLKREDELLLEANRFLFTDTNAITTLTFARYYHGLALSRLIELANCAMARYDLVFVCDTDIPYDDTWDRSGEVNRRDFQRQVIGDLMVRKIPFRILRGNLEERIQQVKRILQNFEKYNTVLDIGDAGSGENTRDWSCC